MPVQRKFDFQLDGKGFMLFRTQTKGRSWHRSGLSDTPSRRSPGSVQYGELPSEVDHVEVWDDWSGGFGQAYRRFGENTYHWAENFDARFPRQLVHAQAMSELTTESGNYIRDFITKPFYVSGSSDWGLPPTQHAGADFIGLGRQIIRRYVPISSVSINAFTIATFSGLTFAGQAGHFNTLAYLPVVEGSGFIRIAGGGGAILEATQGPMPAQAFCVSGNKFWRAHGGAYLQSAASDPIATANWSATIVLGNRADQTNWLADLDGQVFVARPEGLFAGDATGTFVNIIGEVLRRNRESMREVIIYNGQVVFPLEQEIYAAQIGMGNAVIQPIGPAGARNSRSPIRGRFRCLRNIGKWVFTGLWTGSTSYLLAGHDSGEGRFIWHTQQRLPGPQAINRITFDGITAGSNDARIPERCWVTTEPSLAASAPLLFFAIPEFHDNPLLSDPVFSPNYCGSARIDLGAVDWGAPSTPKVYRAVELWADKLASGAQWCQVYYTVDSEATRRLLGTSAKSPKDTLYFPASVQGSFVMGQSIELSLESFTASSAITPIYRAVVLRGALRPRSVDTITALTRTGDNVRDRQGAVMRSGATMLAELRNMATGNNPVQLIDLSGAVNYVCVLPPVEEQDVYQLGQEEPEIAATVKMVVQAFT